MMRRTATIARLIVTAVVLAGAMSHARASGQLPILKACLAQAEKAPNPKDAKNQCIWQHGELMAEYGR